MPEIIVTAGASGYTQEDAIMLRERVNATDFESERFGANLLERLGWAVSDATEAEQHRPAEQRDVPEELVGPEADPHTDEPIVPEAGLQMDRPWEPVGIA